MSSRAPAVARAKVDRPLSEPAVLLTVILALIAIGLLMVYSASRTVQPSHVNDYFVRHLMFVPVALGALALGTLIPYRRLNRWWVAIGLLALAIGLLGLVLVLGEERNGARRWFTTVMGGMRISFQPSELAKVAMVVFLAWFFSRWRTDPRRYWRGFAIGMGAVVAVCGLIVSEDFGTAALVGLLGAVLCLIAGCRIRYFLTVLPFAAIGFWATVWRVPYRLERLTAFVDPWAHQDGSGWHIIQSLMGIGRGGLFGVGLGAGIQKLYLPEQTTDFIFAVLCEEMGILGGILVLGLFGVFIWRAGRVVRRAPDRFGFLLASGVLLMIGLQAVMNIGVVTAALPAKGIGLPFISYGGSGLMMMSLAAGLLASVARRCEAAGAAGARPLVFRPGPARGRLGAAS